MRIYPKVLLGSCLIKLGRALIKKAKIQLGGNIFSSVVGSPFNAPWVRSISPFSSYFMNIRNPVTIGPGYTSPATPRTPFDLTMLPVLRSAMSENPYRSKNIEDYTGRGSAPTIRFGINKPTIVPTSPVGGDRQYTPENTMKWFEGTVAGKNFLEDLRQRYQNLQNQAEEYGIKRISTADDIFRDISRNLEVPYRLAEQVKFMPEKIHRFADLPFLKHMSNAILNARDELAQPRQLAEQRRESLNREIRDAVSEELLKDPELARGARSREDIEARIDAINKMPKTAPMINELEELNKKDMELPTSSLYGALYNALAKHPDLTGGDKSVKDIEDELSKRDEGAADALKRLKERQAPIIYNVGATYQKPKMLSDEDIARGAAEALNDRMTQRLNELKELIEKEQRKREEAAKQGQNTVQEEQSAKPKQQEGTEQPAKPERQENTEQPPNAR